MKVIIVGCGKVGRTIAEILQEEKTELTLVDISEINIERTVQAVDAMGIIGNGTSISTLMEADVEHADILIAVTASDEVNLLCCLIAQKSGQCQTIARVRNPLYYDEINFIKKRLGISMIINPEYDAAAEMARLLRFPSAITIDTFAHGRVELLKFKVQKEFNLHDRSILDIISTYKSDILFCGVENKGGLTIPNGEAILHEGDLVSIVGSPQSAEQFFRKIGLKTHQVRNAILGGGGTTSYYLAKRLIESRVRVKIIEKNMARCEELSDLLPEATIIRGDSTNRALLSEEGLEHAEAFVSLTNMDEENIFLSLYAKTVSDAKLIARVNRLNYDDIIDTLDIDSVIYPKYITAEHIIQYVRASLNSMGSNVETLYQIMDNKAEALEFSIREESVVTGKPLSNLKLKDNLLICCLYRDGSVRIPRGQDSIMVGDTVIIVTTHKGLRDIRDILIK